MPEQRLCLRAEGARKASMWSPPRPLFNIKHPRSGWGECRGVRAPGGPAEGGRSGHHDLDHAPWPPVAGVGLPLT